MAEPFLSEIRLFSFPFPPKGWAHCDGQLLPINQNQALFALLGTIFGGNGQTTFALPDMRGRTPIHAGNGHVGGERGGTESHTLSVSEMPQHTHSVRASTTSGDKSTPVGNFFAANSTPAYGQDAPTPLASGVVSNNGGSQAHENRQPFIVLNYCIALQGIFPSPN